MVERVTAAGTAARDIGALHDRLLRDRALQFDFATVKPPAPVQWPDWLTALGRFLAGTFGGALPAIQWVFWIGVGAAVLLILWLILRESLGVRFSRRRRAKAVRPAPTDWAPDPIRARALLENADRLAAQGRFDLAVRLILHRGIEEIDLRRPRLVRRALTAREIAGLDALPATARTAFATMAAIVEFSAFGGATIGETAFSRCRSAYEAFAFPELWR